MIIEKKVRLSKWKMIFIESGVKNFELLSTDLYVSFHAESNGHGSDSKIVLHLEDTDI